MHSRNNVSPESLLCLFPQLNHIFSSLLKYFTTTFLYLVQCIASIFTRWYTSGINAFLLPYLKTDLLPLLPIVMEKGTTPTQVQFLRICSFASML